MIALAVVLVCLAAAAQSQPAPAAKPAQPALTPRPERQGINDAQLASMLDAYAIEQAQKALGLTSTQYKAFAPRLRRYQELRRRHVQGRNTLLQQLRQLTTKGGGASADDGDIRGTLKALREHDDRAAAESKRAYDELDEVLDVRQQARLRLFEVAMERRKLDLLARARGGARAPNR